MQVIKRDGSKEEFNVDKIINAVKKAFMSCDKKMPQYLYDMLGALFSTLEGDTISIEEIQNKVENVLMNDKFFDVAKSYIIYREQHKNTREALKIINYSNLYKDSKDNAADLSNTDANANVSMKNVVTLEGELHKDSNRDIQRLRMKHKLQELYPEVAKQYSKDLENHIIYTHDESSSALPKNYCEAVTLYPILTDGIKSMDGVTPSIPKHLNSFCGQFNNLVFLLSAQCKGAVAFPEFFNFIDYFCVKDYGNEYHLKADLYADSEYVTNRQTIKDKIEGAFQTIVYYVNQPAQNRGWQSPFTNISYFDRYYWDAMFRDFYFPDGTQPKWERVSWLQKLFMKWFNKERTKALLTFFVETMALLTDKEGNFLDEEYKEFTAEMQAEGHSFFVYISDNPDSLSSCCRLKSTITNNEFSFTNGLTGIKTGSCNVVTLNMNRIIQNCHRAYGLKRNGGWKENTSFIKEYLENILERVYKYHIAYKTILYEWESAGMFNACISGFINMKDLFSTIGINGINEAARFLGMEISYNEDYMEFCRLITSTISEQNEKHSTPNFKFNCEFVPAESLSSKNYNWDLEDKYWVPSDTKIYNSYFYNAWDKSTSVLEKLKLHSREFTETLNGGVGCHINLEEHLSKEQYLKLLEYAASIGTSYFTYNIPNSECSNSECHYIVKLPLDKCPKCGAPMVQYSRVVGFLRPITSYDKGRRWDYNHRIHSKNTDKEIYGKEEIK